MHVITLCVIFLSIILQQSWSVDPYYEACFPRACGNLSISYPFYISGVQEPYCGYPDFGVTCDRHNKSSINISGDNYIIQKISYDDQEIQVTNSAFLHSVFQCIHSIPNLTFNDPRFQLSTSQKTVVLLQNCTENSTKGFLHKQITCISEHENKTVFAVYENEHYVERFGVNCQTVAKVPYVGENGSDVENVLRRGIVLNWTTSNCSACVSSGGRCGVDKLTSEPKCFCPDRPHIYSCRHYSSPESAKKNHLPLILGLGIMGIVFTFAALLAICWYCKRINSTHSKYVSRSSSLDRSATDADNGNIYFGVPLFSYSELKQATDNFDESKELGDGGFGTVYYGKLKDGREVAVKRLYEKNYKRVEQFMNEVQLLTCLRHQNLVSLYGCTSHHSRELLLVYEYVTNGTVADHLYGDKAKDRSLSWSVRLRIATETASALSYLHASDIIHRDVKTNNILLDSSFSVKVADFGLSRFFPTDVTHVSTAPQGTPGYLDPEYGQCYQLTDKSDVYSFGVVLVELISSLPAVDFNRHRHEINLSNYALTRIQRCAFEELVDPQLGFQSDFRVRRMTTAVGELAFRCLQHDKELRPTMDEVYEILRRIESTDYDALHAEETARNDTGAQQTVTRSSPIEDDHSKLLTDRKPFPSSPLSVMDKWGSISTTPNASN